MVTQLLDTTVRLLGSGTAPASATAAGTGTGTGLVEGDKAAPSPVGAASSVDVEPAEVEAVYDRTGAAGSTTGRDLGSDPQAAFTTAKQLIPLSASDAETKTNRLHEEGTRFHDGVVAALDGFPPVELHAGYKTMFSARDKETIQEATELEFVDVGGHAGGAKAVHKGRGLFFKFAFDQEGIYGSMAMAAKAAKREAAASRWVHAMDSIHVNTPLLECVDL